MSQGIHLEFCDDVSREVRARMAYAFRVFAAIYGYKVCDRNSDEPALGFRYGGSSEVGGSGIFRIPARYVPRRPGEAALAPTRCSYAKEDIYLFHGRDEISGSPDWLGEIFEWLTTSEEMTVRERDSVGRIPYDQSVFGRHGVSPLRPHASLIMAWFQNFISGPQGEENLPPALSPSPDAGHLVISSHDIDFYFTGRWKSLVRVVKNLGVAVLVARSFPFFKDSVRQLFRLACGERVGDFLPALLERSQAGAISSTFFVLVKREHRRDANYTLAQVARRLRDVEPAGSSLALHGSYCSIVENSDLEAEVAVLQAETGKRPRGSRQHWLRFDQPEKLFANIEKAGLQYDSSWGWAGQLGFRHGAAFAFPPYNFAREEPYNFLLIPLVLMDQGLQTARRSSAELPVKLADTVLDESRRWGWGGISVLWHNPVEPLSACDDVNQIFWQQARSAAQHGERWMSAEEFMNISMSRYQSAGLLQGMNSGVKAAGERAEVVCEPAPSFSRSF